MLRTTVRLATAALLALTITACSSDDDDKYEKSGGNAKQVEISPGIVGTIEKPESVGGCKTSLQVTWNETDSDDGPERESVEMTYPAAVGAEDGRSLTLYASDDELDLDKLPEAPRRGDEDLLSIAIAAKEQKAAPLGQGGFIDTTKKKQQYDVSVQLLSDDGDLLGDEDAQSNVRLIELGDEGAGVCVRVRHADAEKSVVGTLFAPLTVAPATK